MTHLERDCRISRRMWLQYGGTLLLAGLARRVMPAGPPGILRRPMSDVIVLIPGILGSVLRKDNRDLWALSGEAMFRWLYNAGESVQALTLADDSPGVDDIGDGVVADRLFPDTHLIPGLWKIDGYTKITKYILDHFQVERGRNFFEFPYDWRRDNRVAARLLQRKGESWLRAWQEGTGNPNAKLVLLAHSMGGLVARYFLENLEGWRQTRRLVTFGTPYRGSLNALAVLSNGLKKKVGPVVLTDLTTVVRSFTAVYQLLPTYRCYDRGNGTLARIGEISGIPDVDPVRARLALEFHRDIDGACEENRKLHHYVETGYTLHPIVGTYQKTQLSAKLRNGHVELIASHPEDKKYGDGDGTVPNVSAVPVDPRGGGPSFRDAALFVSELHGSLQNSDTVLQQLGGLLPTDSHAFDWFRDVTPRIALEVDDVYVSDDPIAIRARCDTEGNTLTATVTDAKSGISVSRRTLANQPDGYGEAVLGPLTSGTYRLTITTDNRTASVSDVFVVLPRSGF